MKQSSVRQMIHLELLQAQVVAPLLLAELLVVAFRLLLFEVLVAAFLSPMVPVELVVVAFLPALAGLMVVALLQRLVVLVPPPLLVVALLLQLGTPPLVQKSQLLVALLIREFHLLAVPLLVLAGPFAILMEHQLLAVALLQLLVARPPVQEARLPVASRLALEGQLVVAAPLIVQPQLKVAVLLVQEPQLLLPVLGQVQVGGQDLDDAEVQVDAWPPRLRDELSLSSMQELVASIRRENNVHKVLPLALKMK